MIRDIAREANMSVGHGNSTSRSRTVRSPQGSTNLSIEEVLEAQAATRYLEELVEGGCDRAVILSHLAVIRHSDPRLDDIGYWTGQTRREVEATEEYFQKCASKLESLLERPLKAVLAGPSGRSPLTRAFELPQDLDGLAVSFGNY